MTTERIKYLRTEFNNETISYSELVEIQQTFEGYELGEQFPAWELDDMGDRDKLEYIAQYIYEQTHFTPGISV